MVRTAKEAYRWIAGASRSRRVSRTRRRCRSTYDDALRRGLDALGIDLAPEVVQAIEGHVRLLLAWTPSINLTAIRDADAVATGHVVDSLTALPWIAAHRPQRLLDLGSGGGFPGLPLAAALRPTLPSIEVTLLEPTAKKARFLSTAIEATGLGDEVSVDARRAEDLARDPAARGRWDVITARAVASAADLVELAFPLLAPGGSLVAWKRGDLTAETAAALRAIDALGGGHLEVSRDPGPRTRDAPPDGGDERRARSGPGSIPT